MSLPSRRPPPRLVSCGACRQFVQPAETVCPHCGAPLVGSAQERIARLRERLEALASGDGAAVEATLTLPTRTWRLIAAEAKLAARAGLPGASVYDACAAALANARGCSTAERLVLALPASWLVNARASSPTFQSWLQPPAREAWVQLAEVMAGGPERWLAHGQPEREAAARCARQLCGEGGLAAVSKVLALLAPETVPLMDDAAIAFVTGAIPPPETDDQPRAGAEHLLPMLDAFSRAALEGREVLERIGKAQTPALAPAQVLDRLLWFDSWGLQFFAASLG